MPTIASEFIQRASSRSIHWKSHLQRFACFAWTSVLPPQPNQTSPGSKKGCEGSLYSKKKHMFYSCLFCFWLYQFHPETRNFALWQSFSLKTVPQKSNLISPHGPMARGSWGRFYMVLPSNLLMKRLLSAWKGKKMEGMSIFLEVWSISSRQSHSCSLFSWKLVYLSIQANNTKQHIIHASQKIL